MKYTSTLSTRNQTTLPKEIVKALKAKPSAELSYEVMEDGSVRLYAKTSTFADIMHRFPKKKAARPVTTEDMKLAVAEGAVQRFKRTAAR